MKNIQILKFSHELNFDTSQRTTARYHPESKRGSAVIRIKKGLATKNVFDAKEELDVYPDVKGKAFLIMRKR